MQYLHLMSCRAVKKFQIFKATQTCELILLNIPNSGTIRSLVVILKYSQTTENVLSFTVSWTETYNSLVKSCPLTSIRTVQINIKLVRFVAYNVTRVCNREVFLPSLIFLNEKKWYWSVTWAGLHMIWTCLEFLQDRISLCARWKEPVKVCIFYLTKVTVYTAYNTAQCPFAAAQKEVQMLFYSKNDKSAVGLLNLFWLTFFKHDKTLVIMMFFST